MLDMHDRGCTPVNHRYIDKFVRSFPVQNIIAGCMIPASRSDSTFNGVETSKPSPCAVCQTDASSVRLSPCTSETYVNTR